MKFKLLIGLTFVLIPQFGFAGPCSMEPPAQKMACYTNKEIELTVTELVDFASELKNKGDLDKARVLFKQVADKDLKTDVFKKDQAKAIYEYTLLVDKTLSQDEWELYLKKGADLKQGKVSGKMAHLYAIMIQSKDPTEAKKYYDEAQQLGFDLGPK